MNSTVRGRTLAALLPENAGAFGDVEITGLVFDSRAVQPGDLFFALAGVRADGAEFAAAAVEAGAVAVVTQRPLSLSAPVIVVENPRRALAEASHRFHGHPDRALRLIGVVGTNGKSTVAAGLRAVWESSGVKAGSIGTVDYSWGKETIAAERTTPEVLFLDQILSRMRTDEVAVAAVEVSSHALALDRVWGLNFRGGVFTNITRDHLDFHKTFENYTKAKQLFFERLSAPDAFAAINADDPGADGFVRAAATARIVRYSISDSTADVYLKIEQHDLNGSTGELVIDGAPHKMRSRLWGGFNHSNLAAIAAGAFGSGVDGDAIARGIEQFDGVPGRLEEVGSGMPFRTYVDFAHTPDALNAVLSAARPLVKGKLAVVFGCGGDRDRGKRPEMARAVEQWADRIYLTSDNPRSEDPERIIADTRAGFETQTRVWCGSDRARAIRQAVADAGAGDVILLCGKGHEQTQEVAGVKHRFSDSDEVVQALATVGQPSQTPAGDEDHSGLAVGLGGDPSPTR